LADEAPRSHDDAPAYDAARRPAYEPGAGEPHASNPGFRLPSERRKSPWSRRLVLIVIVSVLLVTPLWLDPVTLDQFRGATPFPIPTGPIEAIPTVAGSPDGEEVFTVSTTVARDDFERNEPIGWGAAELGGRYAPLGASELVSATDGVGTARLSDDESGGATLPGVNAHDVEVLFDVSGEALSLHGVFVEAILRLRPGGQSYRPTIEVADDGGAMVTIRASNGETVTSLVPAVAVDGLLAQSGDEIRVRAQAIGSDPTTVRVRAWSPSSPEPTVWQASVIDWTGSLQHDGAIGMGWGASSPVSQSAPVLRFDDLVARANAEVGNL
jgi:hypothetical protein